jgi:hypothetical protein
MAGLSFRAGYLLIVRVIGFSRALIGVNGGIEGLWCEEWAFGGSCDAEYNRAKKGRF